MSSGYNTNIRTEEEVANEPDYVFDCHIINGRNVLKYLEPNSRVFFTAVMYIADSMNITAYDDAV